MSITGVGNSSLSNQVNFKSGFASQKPPIPPFAETCSDNKKSKTAKYAAGAVTLAALVAAGIAFKGKIGKVLSSLGNKAPEAIQGTKGTVSDVAERTLSNGKKVIKTVTEKPDGTKTVEMKLFNPDGELAYTKTKNITRTVDENGTVISRIDKYSANGNKVDIQLGKDKDSYGYDWLNKDQLAFTKSGEREIIRTYDKNNKLIGRDTRLFSTENDPMNNTVRFERLTFEPETGKVSSKSQHWRRLSDNNGLVNTMSFDCKGDIPEGKGIQWDLRGFPDEICDKLRIKAGNVMYGVTKKPVYTFNENVTHCTITDGAKS